MDRKEDLFRQLKNEINIFIGKKFEKVCQQFLILSGVFPFTNIGKQWGDIPLAEKDKNQYEIDIVALNKSTKDILFCECKWQDKVNAEKVIKYLIEKAKCVEWNNGSRTESYAVFAKSFKEKIKAFEGKKAYCFDLKDMEKILTREK